MSDHKISTGGDCERTAWVAALRWVLASPTRIWGSSVGVCVHGIGSHHPCQVCREDVIRRKIAELEEQKP